MDPRELKTILRSFKDGALSEDEMLERLRHLPYEDVGDALVDHHRGLRQGFPEVIFGAGKSAGQVERIMASLAAKGNNILVTRLDEAKALAVKEAFPAAVWHADARCLTLEPRPVEKRGLGTVLVISAGTSDLPVAAEALVTLRMLGNEASHLYDVGVAGIHRLLSRRDVLFSARVLIVVAGMEGALPSVVGGARGPAGHRRSHVGWLRGFLRRHRRAAGHAQLLCRRRDRGEYRQRVRRRRCREHNQQRMRSV